MQHQHITSNPFALLLDPDAVHQALARSEHLNSLKSRVWRPLDQPLIPRTNVDGVALDDNIDDGDADDSDIVSDSSSGER